MDDLHASIYFSLLILLAGDIQLNPGPHTLATLYNQSGNCSFELSGHEIGVDSLVDGSAGASDSRDEELGVWFADRILLRDCVAQEDCERLGPEAGALVEGFRCRQVGPDPAGLMEAVVFLLDLACYLLAMWWSVLGMAWSAAWIRLRCSVECRMGQLKIRIAVVCSAERDLE